MPTVAEIQTIRPIAQYLCQLDIAKSGLYSRGINSEFARKIYLIGKSVKRIYDNDPTDTTIYATSYFLYTLLGMWGKRAEIVAGGSGGGGNISPLTPTSSLPLPLDFEVSGSSVIADGQSSVLLLNYAGYNLDFVRNGMSQNTTNVGGSYFSWDRTTCIFTCSPAAVSGELFRLTPIG